MKLINKVAIVTGSSRGLGKAIALAFAAEGATVIVTARTVSKLEETVSEITSRGGKALAVKCDVTNEEHVNNMVQKAFEEFNRIDILVNNAGVAFYYPVTETPLKHFELVIRVNLTGAFLCSKAVLPKMIEQRSGSIINISSLAANERDAGIVSTGVAYAIAKAGLDRFTWGLAAEVGKYNIAVNALKPANIIDTEGMRYWMPNADKSHWETPDKMVKCATFLATQDAKGVTGIVATNNEIYSWHGLD